MKQKEAIKKRIETEQTAQHTRTAEERFRSTLQREFGRIRLLGSPDIESISVDLLDVFVNLDISPTYRTEKHTTIGDMERLERWQRDLSPDKVVQRAFEQNSLLVVIGDPGSGKTTLLRYYAMCCLKEGANLRRTSEVRCTYSDLLPIYLPLRDVKPGSTLAENLTGWAESHTLKISADEFHDWLHNRPSLMLLDGLTKSATWISAGQCASGSTTPAPDWQERNSWSPRAGPATARSTVSS